jgi:putative hydrolase of the HAD superfamily
MIKAIIFDLGDTLILNAATRKMINKSQLTFDLFVSKGVQVSWEAFLEAEQKARDIYDFEYNGNVKRFEAGFFYEKLGEALGLNKPREFYVEIDEAIENKFLENIQTPKGLKETLEILKNKELKLAVISNGHRRTISKKLEGAQITNYFSKIFISFELGEDKSSLNAFKKMTKFLGVEAQECVMIGDRLDEDMYAQKIRMWTGLVKYVPAKPIAKEALRPHFELNRFSDLPKIIKKINKGEIKFA